MMLQWMRLQQEFRLRSSNPEPLMSALGQKQTSQHLQPMSALLPKADIRILFDQLIGALLEKWGHVETEQLGCLEINH